MSDLLHCQHYLAQQHVLTLCSQANNQLWAANCFYAFDAEQMCFWIMTDLDTLHGQMMRDNPQIAGTVSDQTRDISELQGIQFSAQATLLTGQRAEQARLAYQQQFPIARKKQAPLWGLAIERLKMTDNRLGFGHKIIWQREQ